MAQAITTRHLGPTDARGTRVLAVAFGGRGCSAFRRMYNLGRADGASERATPPKGRRR